ncbi:hypothetical protein Tco_1032464 [Tanacetum coccineum]|uniref:Uncharacterized protein n=1 Tax=Tanacetum coccineum TaxID=301880 RepID=A0ABQ5GDM2_9ASTR
MQITHVAKEAATMSHDSPLLRVHSLGSDEGSITLHELTVLYTTLSKKVESLESDLKQTKLTYGAAYTKLIMKVKKLENRIKSSKPRRRVRLIVSEDEDDLEDLSKQVRKIPYTAGAEVSTVSPEVKTTAESLVYNRRSATKRKDKGKAIMKEAEPVQKKTKLQLEQERLGLVPKISTGSSKRTAETELEHEGVGNHTEAYQTFDDMLKKFDTDDLDKLWSLVKERFSSTDPTDDKERTLWVKLKRLFEPDINDILWKLQRYMHDPLI